MKVACCRSGCLLQRCTRALKLVKHFTPLIFSSLSWLYPCSRFPAQPPAHTAAHITPTNCICSHLYKVGPHLPFRQPGIFALQLPSTATDSSCPQLLCLPLLLERQHFCRNTFSTSDTTTGPSLLAVHTWRHLYDTPVNSLSFWHDCIWDTSRNGRDRNRLQLSIQHVSALVLKSPRKVHSLEYTYNYTCFNARPPETSFFEHDLSLNI